MNSQQTKVLSRKDLARLSREMTTAGKVLVLTNGCFDLLHVGHVRYLRAARSFGDALAVGVNSDESVRKLKGPGRPLTPEDDRAEILAALEVVDAVTVFDEETAAALVRAVQPPVYVKGGDYTDEVGSDRYPPEGHLVEAYGGRVRIVPYIAGRSTSALINSVRANEQLPE